MLSRVRSTIEAKKLEFQLKTYDPQTNIEFHIKHALTWFKQSLLEEGGSSAKFALIDKRFYPAYPETSGYWINTLYAVRQYHPELHQSVFGTRDIAGELTRWLLSIQRRDGTFPGSYGKFLTQPPRVFNIGQIILGLLGSYERTPEPGLKDALIGAANWLVTVQANTGMWEQFTMHQYSSNTRTAWALIKLGKMVRDERFIEAGIRNVDYAISLQSAQGFFNDNGFDAVQAPYTHTIAYAIRGMLEAGLILERQDFISAAQDGFDPLLNLIKDDGFVPGQIETDFSSQFEYCCLTGNCQLALIAFSLYSLTQETKYREAGKKLLRYVKSKQLCSKNGSIDGGISGSWPVGGNYNRYEIPNWSAKFFVDALLKEQISNLELGS